MAFDFKKEYKEFYMPKSRPELVTVPPMNYIAVRGKGDPDAPRDLPVRRAKSRAREAQNRDPAPDPQRRMIADFVTLTRLLLSPLLLWAAPLSRPFYALYLLCGLTDMTDGFLARKLHTASAAGAKLDSLADAVFAAVCLIRLLPVLPLTLWMGVLIGVIGLVRLVSLILLHRKHLSPLHTIADKIAGLLVFLLPLTLPLVDLRITALPVCAVALFAAVQEGYRILRSPNSDGTEISS